MPTASATTTDYARPLTGGWLHELRAEEQAEDDGRTLETRRRIRRPGGGRKRLTETQPGILDALRRLVEPYENGDPERPLKWTSKSLRKLAKAMQGEGFVVSHTSLQHLANELGIPIAVHHPPPGTSKWNKIEHRLFSYITKN